MRLPHNMLRLLKAIRSTEWNTSEELLDGLGLERGPSRTSYQHSLRRLVRDGLAERNDSAWPYLYRATDAGRRIAKEL